MKSQTEHMDRLLDGDGERLPDGVTAGETALPNASSDHAERVEAAARIARDTYASLVPEGERLGWWVMLDAALRDLPSKPLEILHDFMKERPSSTDSSCEALPSYAQLRDWLREYATDAVTFNQYEAEALVGAAAVLDGAEPFTRKEGGSDD